MKRITKVALSLAMSGVIIFTEFMPVSAMSLSSSAQLGGANGKYYMYSLNTKARDNLYFPLNFVFHKKGTKDGQFDATLTKGDEVGVTASLTYGMDAYFADITAEAGISATSTMAISKSYTVGSIPASKSSGYFIIEGSIPGTTTKTQLVVVDCEKGKTITNKSDSYGFTPQSTAIIGFHYRQAAKTWPKVYASDEKYVLKCKQGIN